MPIKYYPNRVYKRSVPAIDRVMAQRRPVVVRGHSDITSTGIDTRIICNNNWQLDSIKFNFTVETAKDYDVKVLSGVNIVQNLNDYLYFQSPNSVWQKIILSPGFYTGSELAVQLEAKLDANTAFSDLGMTFDVAYSTITGKFTITVLSGVTATLRYINVVNMPLPDRDSIAGFLFGLNATTAYVSPIESDTPMWGYGQEAWIVSEANATAVEHYVDDIHILTMDQALHFTTTTAATLIDYEFVYEEMV